MSDVAREMPEHAASTTDSSTTGPGRHRGPAAPSEDTQPKSPGNGRHRRDPGD